jgi:DNA mismatch repair protein MutS
MSSKIHNGLPNFSLLNPVESDQTTNLENKTLIDLNLDFIINEMIVDKKERDIIKNYTSRLCLDGAAINYRLDILDDIMTNESIVDCLEDLSTHTVRLKYYMGNPGKTDAMPLQESVWRLRELEEYLYCMEFCHKTLADIPLKSEGLTQFRNFIEFSRPAEDYVELKKELPHFLSRINKIKSVTVAINLNEGLIPFEAAIVEVNPCHYEHSSFFGKMAAGPGGKSSMGPIHTTRDTAYSGDPTMLPLFKDLSHILGKSVNPLKNRLRKYGISNTFKLLKHLDELLFYRGAVRLIKKVQGKGFPMVRPVICKERHYRKIKGIYNLELALSNNAGSVVFNDFHSFSKDRNFIITGPNNGGKTTFLRAVGIVQYLAQLGLYVPAQEAVLSVCSNIYTHFPNLETRCGGMGRFAEEADRLKKLVENLQPYAMILLNESLSSTNMEEAGYIARDILQILAEREGFTLFVTHLHSLAIPPADRCYDDYIDIKSLVAQMERTEGNNYKPDYRVLRASPDGKSYALEMARNFGLGIDQLRGEVI